MLFEEFKNTYALSDGRILQMVCDFEQKIVRLDLLAWKKTSKKSVSCQIQLNFVGTFELDLLETFDSGYSDVTLSRLPNEGFYLSLDPFGNSDLPSDNDNFVIKSRELDFVEGEHACKLE
jgi:hypothetical protein